MKKKADHTPNERMRRNMQFIEERLDLLDTIREMINIEFERREMRYGRNPHPEKPPPGAGRETPEGKSPGPSFWRRVLSLFTRQ